MTYALMYLAHPEDIEYGTDKNHWYKFKINGKVKTQFATLEELLKAIMTQLYPNPMWKFGDIYKITGHKNNYFGELNVHPWPHEVEDFRYENGRKVTTKYPIFWMSYEKYGTSRIYNVDKNGKLTHIRYVRS